MRQAEYEAYLRKRGFGDATVKYSVGAVLELEGALGGKALNIIGVEDLRAYFESLIPRRRNSERRLVAIARYFHIVGNKPAYIYLVSLIGPRGGPTGARGEGGFHRRGGRQGEDLPGDSGNQTYPR
jgi:hypothetical protein